MSLEDYYGLPVAFQFSVVPLNPAKAAAAMVPSLAGGTDDTAFSEVSGLEATMEMDSLNEGGENRYVHQLPTKMSHPNLQLKRGVAPVTSAIVVWCKSVLEGGLNLGLTPSHLLVSLLDEQGMPLRSWAVFDALPVKWQVDGFNSTKNEVAIETIELTYSYSERMV